MPPATASELLSRLGPVALSVGAAAAQMPEVRDLVESGLSPASAIETDRQVQALVTDHVRRLRAGGWHVDEVARVVGLRCEGAEPSRVFAELVGRAEGSGIPADSEPLFATLLRRCPDPRLAVVTVAAIVAVLDALQPLPLFDPTDHADLDRDVLRKVRALLAKAESTDFEAEAESLTAKAHDLITRHALDGLGVDPDMGSDVRSRRVPLDAPYASAKSILLSAVATANRCQSVQCRFTQTAIVFGVPADLTAVEMLYTSLLTQATSAMLSAGSIGDGRGRNRTKSFRRSFLLGFAQRVGQRLAATAEAAVDLDRSKTLVPALRARSVAVEQAIHESFDSVRTRRVSHSSGVGFGAGDRAGATADLGAARVGGARKGLPGVSRSGRSPGRRGR